MEQDAASSFNISSGNWIHKMSKSQADCQDQVRNLINKLSSWRDESHKQMANIINSQSRSIYLGFNGLVKEFSDLEAEVSELRRERKVLMGTIDNLNNELNQMNVKLLQSDYEIQEEDSSDIKEKCEDIHNVSNDANVSEVGDHDKDIVAQNINESNNQDPSAIDLSDLDTSAFSDIDYEDSSVYMQEETNWAPYEEDFERIDHMTAEFACGTCKFVFSRSEYLEVHLIKFHQNPDKNEESNESKEQKNLSLKNHFQGKVAEMSSEQNGHNNTDFSDIITTEGKNSTCNLCPFSAKKRSYVIRHWDAVHNEGDKRFKCENCPYSTAEKIRLKQHNTKYHSQKLHPQEMFKTRHHKFYPFPKKNSKSKK